MHRQLRQRTTEDTRLKSVLNNVSRTVGGPMQQKLPAKSNSPRNLVEAIERERRMLAQELHDDLNQDFVVLSIEMELLERKLSASDAAHLRSIRERVNEMIDTTRSIARRLHPSI